MSSYAYSASNPPVVTVNRDRMMIDNLIRRELKVGDPSDADQIARALAERYQRDTRAQAIVGEARGLPFLQSSTVVAPAPVSATPTGLDLKQARQDVATDMEQLLRSNLTKDVRPELEGWSRTIHGIIDEGVAAAGQGLDPFSRDRAFAARRQLGEYARLARMIGTFSPELNDAYRNLAQSLDEVAAVLLVLMGESLANTGFAGGRYLLKVPYSELQARRDHVLVALRNLSGAAQESLDQSVMPRGSVAYRLLFSTLESGGHAELRALLSESELARGMDEMIQLASGGSSDGLRRIGATAWSVVGRFNRFVQITLAQVASDAPPLLAFQDALQLFIDGFNAGGGFRLLRIARPSVLMAGLYGSSGLLNSDKRLMKLVQKRGDFAHAIDNLTRCSCGINPLSLQPVLDRVLFDLDRAIDLYSVGCEDFGLPEQRAAAASWIIRAMLDLSSRGGNKAKALVLGSESERPVKPELEALLGLLAPTSGEADWDAASRVAFGNLKIDRKLTLRMHGELVMQLQADRTLRPVIEQMSSLYMPVSRVFAELHGGRSDGKLSNADKFGALMAVQHAALMMLESRGDLTIQDDRYNMQDLKVPSHLDKSVAGIQGRLDRLRDQLQDSRTNTRSGGRANASAEDSSSTSQQGNPGSTAS